MKIAIITDSVAYLSSQEVKEKNIYVLPLSVTIENQTYEENSGLSMDEFYHLVNQSAELPKSSQPIVGNTMALFERLSKEYDAAIAIHLSSDISGTYQTVYSLKDEYENFKIYPVDSKRACGSQAQLVRIAKRMADENVPVEEIVNHLVEDVIPKQNAYFLVDNLMHLQKGGRLSAGAAIVGSMLNIKPILTINGKITPTEKIRTFKKGLSRIEELFAQDIKKIDGVVKATIHHANRLDDAEYFKAQLLQSFNNIEVDIVEFGPVIATHLGEKSMGLIYGPRD